MSRRFSLGARAGLVALGLAAGLVAAEVVVRLAGAAPEVVWLHRGRFQLATNPRIGYEPIPNLTTDGPIDSFHDYSGTSNGLGFRDRERAPAKTPGVFRILVLGDSIAAGQGVERFEDTFPPLVEEELNRAGFRAEVLNFAVAGYNTEQEMETLKDKGLAFAPDLVLLAYCLNDFRRDDGGILTTLLADAQDTGGLLRSRVDRRLAPSALYRFLRFRFGEVAVPVASAAIDTRAESFDLFRSLADRHHFEVVVAIFPRFGKILDYKWDEHHREVAELAGRNRFHILDLLEAYQACFQTTDVPLALNRYHPSARGHRCAARAISAFILEHRDELGG